MNSDIIEQALRYYNVKPTKFFDEEHGYRNKSYHVQSKADHLNLILYKNESGILERVQRADTLSEYAWRSGLPVRHLYNDRTLTLRGKTKTLYARLYYYLPGQTIAWEMYTMKHIKLLGWAMSDLHSSIKTAKVKLPRAESELLDQVSYISKYFADTSVQQAILDKLRLAIPLLIFPRFKQTILFAAHLPAQPLHLDLVRGNILFSSCGPKTTGTPWQIGNVCISGIIDFEKAALGAPLFDIARTYAFLLADCANKTPEQIYKYLIYSGYNKRGSADIWPNTKLLQALVDFYLFYDFYKFLEHNPYEFLRQNHHFLRTKDILITRGVIQSA